MKTNQNCHRSLHAYSFFQLSLCALLLHLGASLSWAQGTGFTYQGQLRTSGAPANGAHDFEFKLFDALTGGNQLGATNTLTNVTVTNGVFTLTLDFGAQFNGQPRWLEISARTAGAGTFTPLTPRQPLTATPYAVRSASAAIADNATQLGGTAANQFVQTNDARLTDDRNPKAGSTSYIQNTTFQQASANFHIAGNGTAAGRLSAGTINADVQYNLNGVRILDANLSSNLYVGLNAGTNNTANNNTFVGHSAGTANTTAGNNTFVGYIAGQTNLTGDLNTFVGSNAGRDNTEGTQNTFIGTTAGLLNTIGNFNTFVGRNAGRENVNGDDNSFFGDDAGTKNATGIQNSYFGSFAGTNGTIGDNHTFIGYRAGDTNTIGGNNTALGAFADVLTNNLINATAIGFRAAVNANNALVLGGINGVNGATASTNVGIGTTTPTFRLHVRGGNQEGIKIQNGGGDFQQIRWTDASDAFKAAISVGPVGSEGMRFFVNGADRMIIENAGTVQLFNLGAGGTNQLCRNPLNQIASCSSSLRYKQNIAPFASGLNLVKRLQPITFDWKAGGAHDLGLGAEDVAAISELLVIRNEKGEVEGVKYDRIGVVLINAVKEQQAQLAQQAALLKEQQAMLQQQQAQIVALQKLVKPRAKSQGKR